MEHRYSKYAPALCAMLSFLWPCFGLKAHQPLFMMSHEAPGKDAFDFHTEFLHKSKEKATEFVLAFSYGLTRDFAFELELPTEKSRNTPRTIGDRKAYNTALKDPVLSLKWRFWDKDLPGKKFAAAWGIKSSLPIGSSASNIQGSIYPNVESGLSTGMESLHYYYFIDIRYLYHAPRPAKPGDRIFVDFAPGWRPRVGSLEETDIVFFLELNFVHIKRSERLVAANRLNDYWESTQSGGLVYSLPIEERYRLYEDLSLRANLPEAGYVQFKDAAIQKAYYPLSSLLSVDEKGSIQAEYRANPLYVFNQSGQFVYRPQNNRDTINRNTGGDALFLAPEILLSPSNRFMFRFGIQIPVWKNLRKEEEVGSNLKLTMEIRF